MNWHMPNGLVQKSKANLEFLEVIFNDSKNQISSSDYIIAFERLHAYAGSSPDVRCPLGPLTFTQTGHTKLVEDVVREDQRPTVTADNTKTIHQILSNYSCLRNLLPSSLYELNISYAICYINNISFIRIEENVASLCY